MIWSLYDCKNYCNINFAVSIKLCDWSGRDILIKERKYLSQDSRVDYFTRLLYYMVKKKHHKSSMSIGLYLISTEKLTSPYEWKILEWVVKPHTNKKLKSWVEDEFNVIPILYIFLVILVNRKKLLNIIISSIWTSTCLVKLWFFFFYQR